MVTTACHPQLSRSELHVQAKLNTNSLSAAAGVRAEVKTLTITFYERVAITIS